MVVVVVVMGGGYGGGDGDVGTCLCNVYALFYIWYKRIVIRTLFTVFPRVFMFAKARIALKTIDAQRGTNFFTPIADTVIN